MEEPTSKKTKTPSALASSNERKKISTLFTTVANFNNDAKDVDGGKAVRKLTLLYYTNLPKNPEGKPAKVFKYLPVPELTALIPAQDETEAYVELFDNCKRVLKLDTNVKLRLLLTPEDVEAYTGSTLSSTGRTYQTYDELLASLTPQEHKGEDNDFSAAAAPSL
jgi:hypothetical protein